MGIIVIVQCSGQALNLKLEEPVSSVKYKVRNLYPGHLTDWGVSSKQWGPEMVSKWLTGDRECQLSVIRGQLLSI